MVCYNKPQGTIQLVKESNELKIKKLTPGKSTDRISSCLEDIGSL